MHPIRSYGNTTAGGTAGALLQVLLLQYNLKALSPSQRVFSKCRGTTASHLPKLLHEYLVSN